MDQVFWEAVAKNGIFAILLVVVATILWREIRRVSDKAQAREERMHEEALAREDRLMKLAEGLTERFEVLARQNEELASDVHEIKAIINGKDAA
ncbi:BhlA/UviB family holin-like peptide [Paenibacillus motobuensis]|uniref:Holin n=1 Tax=Paenibacillus motobuensis TaxID=295324 RepID=A0ABN0YKI0_9BACL